MKQLLMLSLLFFCSRAISQDVISSYDDTRLPKSLVSSVKNLKTSSFENYSKNATETKEYNGVKATFQYDVSYSNGNITGTLEIKGKNINLSFDIKLPFEYCCDNHNPAHCANTSEQLKKYQQENKCKNWQRAKID